PEVSERVYREMAWRAGLILAEGGSVVADAVFDRPGDRARIERAASERGLPFLGIWLDAAPDLLWQRVDRRTGGPSDATVDILSRQLERDAGAIAWQRLDAARSPARIVADILALLPPDGA
ncbi:MAG: AAA family ATPase, partial [Aquamicrobium sp.]|nr:AAA family ATPase [Aquamicrobium sp.]